MYEILIELSTVSVTETFNTYKESEIEIINEYLDFLLKKEFGFFCDEEDLLFFPNMDSNFELPYKITNSIIELKADSLKDKLYLIKIINELDKVKCRYINLILKDYFSIKETTTVLDTLKNSKLISIDLVLSYQKNYTETFFNNISEKYFTVTNVIVHSSPFVKKIPNQGKQLFNVYFTKTKVDIRKSCGNIELKYFNVNQDKYFESLAHNSCLNCKISIDYLGNIRNCPSMPQNFGNIKNITLDEAISQLDFKKYWNVTKDDIEICKDCEFRHICTDCRAYTEDPHNDRSKPLKCGYNPYTNKWEEWSTNPLKQKAIEYYGMQDLVIKDA